MAAEERLMHTTFTTEPETDEGTICFFPDVESLQTIAEELDRVRRLVADLGPATLLAEIRETPTEVVRSALAEVGDSAARAVELLRDWGRLGR